MADRKIAKASLREEQTAVKAYGKRIPKAKGAALKKVLRHNLEEEREHARNLKSTMKKGKR